MSATIVDWPQASWCTPQRVEWGLESRILVTRSIFSGAAQTADTPFKRWRVVMTLNNVRREEQGYREGLISSIRASSARVRLWHHGRERPVGTIGGVVTTNAPVAQFATTAQFNCTTGMTIVRGDMFRIGSTLVQATQSHTAAAGVIVCEFAPPLRQAVGAGVAVVYERPTADFILMDNYNPVPTEAAHGPAFALSFDEIY